MLFDKSFQIYYLGDYLIDSSILRILRSVWQPHIVKYAEC